MPSLKRQSDRAYTLLEVLVMVAVLGLAAAMVVPSMNSTNVLKIQASVRAVVADLTFAQSDALAFQQRRAIVFDLADNSFRVVEVTGATLDPINDVLLDPTRRDGIMEIDFDEDTAFEGTTILSADFDGDTVLIYDELGGPVQTLTGDTPSIGGTVRLSGSGGRIFDISVEAYTGRVTVTEVVVP
jgi:type II secretory pathway pseudopilin PulG